MTDEHRLTFELSQAAALEVAALDSVVEKMYISKRSHEYIRRIMVQGLLLTKVLKKVGRGIPEIEQAIALSPNGGATQEFKFRLNVETTANEAKTPEEEIWETVSKISRRDHRKSFLRELFLHGYWFESLAERDLPVINQLIGAGAPVDDANVVELPQPPAKNSAKSKLGGLMPI